jgi:hypothetical protein
MDAIDALKENALIQRLRDECILVTLKWTDKKELTPKLTFKIDYRDVEAWKRSLIEKGERFSMVDTRNGETIFETHKLTEEPK